MTEGQWISVFMVAIGVYFGVCSLWARNFVLYRLKIRRIERVIGEKAAHGFYLAMATILIVAGILQATKIWVV